MTHYPRSLETAQIELEAVSRCGFQGCSLVYTDTLGWVVTCPQPPKRGRRLQAGEGGDGMKEDRFTRFMMWVVWIVTAVGILAIGAMVAIVMLTIRGAA